MAAWFQYVNFLACKTILAFACHGRQNSYWKVNSDWKVHSLLQYKILHVPNFLCSNVLVAAEIWFFDWHITSCSQHESTNGHNKELHNEKSACTPYSLRLQMKLPKPRKPTKDKKYYYRLYRQTLKEEMARYSAFKEKDAARSRVRRKEMTPEQRVLYNERPKIRMREIRERKKSESSIEAFDKGWQEQATGGMARGQTATESQVVERKEGLWKSEAEGTISFQEEAGLHRWSRRGGKNRCKRNDTPHEPKYPRNPKAA